MAAQLQLGDYYRMECVTVPCPACGSYRGELCKGKNVAYYHGSGHTDRKNAFRHWVRFNRDAYLRLKQQLMRERFNDSNNELYMGEN